MRLRLFCPPVLVHLQRAGSAGRPALLLASRDRRCFVQVHRARGDNVLRWVPAGWVVTAAEPPSTPPADHAGGAAVGSVGYRPGA